MSTGFNTEPGSREPGLDHLIKALTADGYPHELARRDAALAAFRAASRQPPRRAPISLPRLSLPRLSLPHSRSGRWSTSARLSTVAALVAAIAGVTAAAYAQALPGPVQRIAYSVLAPLGVPDSPNPTGPSSRAPSGTAPGSAPSSAAAGGHGTASPSPSCPCPSPTPTTPARAGSVLVLTVGRGQLPAGGTEAISGKLTDHGRPESGVRVRLLEQVAGSPGWQQAGSGVTGQRGRVRFGILRLTRNTAFRLAAAGGARSPEVSVTVIPRVLLRLVAGMTADRLVASAWFGDPGDTAVLQQLSGGAWQTIATQPLGAAHRTVFKMPAATLAGAQYRVVLQATSAHGPGVSGPVRVARLRSGIGAKVIVPDTSQSPTTTIAASPTATVASPTAGPTPSPAPPPALGQPTATPDSPAESPV